MIDALGMLTVALTSETGKSRQLKPEEYFFAGMEITKRATQMEATITAQTMEPDSAAAFSPSRTSSAMEAGND